MITHPSTSPPLSWKQRHDLEQPQPQQPKQPKKSKQSFLERHPELHKRIETALEEIFAERMTGSDKRFTGYMNGTILRTLVREKVPREMTGFNGELNTPMVKIVMVTRPEWSEWYQEVY